MKRTTPWWQRLLILAAGLIFAWPIWYMLATALTPAEQVLAERGWRALWPDAPTLAHFRRVLGDSAFLRFMGNSLLITGSTVVIGVLVNAWCGFALARLSWHGRGVVLGLIAALMIIPFEAVAVPLFVLAARLGWTDSYSVQVLPFVANPFAVILFTTFFKNLPRELDEAARIDGASSWQIFWRVALPLAKPAVASVAILTFILQWGMYLWPLMVTSEASYRPLPVAMGVYSQQRPPVWGEVMAFGTLMVLPVLLLFLLMQRAFIRGLSSAAVKG